MSVANRLLVPVVTAYLALPSVGRAQQTSLDTVPRLTRCYLLRYADFRSDRVIGPPVGGRAVAPEVIVLSRRRSDPELTLGNTDTFAAAVMRNAKDTTFYPAYWHRQPSDFH